MQGTTSGEHGRPPPGRVTLSGLMGLCGLAAAVSIFRASRSSETAGVVLALGSASLALLALAMSLRYRRLASLPLAAAVLMEVSVLLGPVAPPRIVNAIPLMFALGLALAPADIPRVRAPGPGTQLQRVAIVVSLALMVPLGLAYLVGPNIFAPYPDIYVSYVLFAVLITVTVTLARRQSWWVAAMPFVSLGLFLLMVQVGVAYRDWGG